MPTRSQFGDAETWMILTAPTSMSGAGLARMLGRDEHAVQALRARLRRDGWTCRVEYRLCRLCGEVMTVPGLRSGRLAYHPACRPHALRDIGRRNDRDRWERMSGDERQQRLDRAHRHSLAMQAASIDTASSHRRRWTADDDSLILDPNAPPDHEIAEQLSRTLYAVRARRKVLRQRQP